MTACAACGAELPQGARFCPACGAPAEPVPPATEERKLATVLFADLVGSTELGGSQDPERTRALLGRFYDAMTAEVEAAGGTVEKFAGDAVMAAFGVPTAHEDHAERALHSALSMQRRLHDVFGGELSLRVGVNTGEVVVGKAREGSSFVTGDAVNVAARLEQAAAPGEVLAGERTVAAARGAFEFDEPSTVEAKGKPGGVACRRLVRALSLMRPRGVGGLRQAFVGRESELELLRATYRRVAGESRAHVVTIMGESGVGKTRLLRELWEWLAIQEPEPLRRTGRCLPYGDGITYWPLGELLREHLGLYESDSADAALERLGAREILGLTLGLDVAGDLHPLTARERLHEAWVEFLHDLVSEQPVVVLVEDLHWAEEELLDLLERLVRDVDGPLLLLATARPELLDRRASWGAGRRNASLLWLEPLSAADTERMAAELLAGELPAAVRDVLDQAEGNPFFVEELVATLIDRGFLNRRNGEWTVADLPPDFAVPDSVQAVLAARIDLLPAVEKQALQAASVIGRIFWAGPVRELVGAEPDFDLLEERDFIRHRSGSSVLGEREYAVKHALTREVAYASLPKARRAHLHAAVARWIERAGEGRDDLAPLLAHHYAEAVRPEDADLAWADSGAELAELQQEALKWLRRAADLAVARYEIDEGLALLHRALGLEESVDGRSEVWREIGRANALKFDGEGFWTAMQKSLEICTSKATCADSYAELALQTVTRAGMWQRLPDDDVVQGWIDQALTLSQPGDASHAKALIAKVVHTAKRRVLMDAAAAAREASTHADRLGDPELRIHALGAHALVAQKRGDHEEALAWARRQFELFDDIKDPDLVADAHSIAIPSEVALGRFSEARRLAQSHDDIASRLTAHHRVHAVAILIEVETLAGGWETIYALRERTEDAVDDNLETPCVRNVLSQLLVSLACVHLGDDAESRRLERRAEEIGYEEWQLPDVPRLRLALARGDLERAGELIGGILQPEGEAWFGLITSATLLDAAAALRDRERVEGLAEPSLRRGNPYLEAFALRALGLVREDEALVGRAAERFEAMRLDWHAAETRKLLAA